MINTIVISDIHLGSPLVRSEKLLEILEKPFDRLIINGDLFDHNSFGRYNKKDWKILSKIRKLTKTKEVIFTLGNHEGCPEFFAAITGMDLVNEYSFEINKRRFLASHGDIYDNVIGDHPFLVDIVSGIYYWFQRADKNQKISRWLKRKSKSWTKAKNKVSDNFFNDRGDDFDVLIAGHTHHGEIKQYENGVTYVNTGSFCEVPSHYMVINHDGTFSLEEV